MTTGGEIKDETGIMGGVGKLGLRIKEMVRMHKKRNGRAAVIAIEMVGIKDERSRDWENGDA